MNLPDRGVAIYQEKPTTVVVMRSVARPNKCVVGVARCCPTDKWDAMTGVRIAFRRALRAERRVAADPTPSASPSYQSLIGLGPTLIHLCRSAGFNGVDLAREDIPTWWAI